MFLALTKKTLEEIVPSFVSRYCFVWRGCLELLQSSCDYDGSQPEDKSNFLRMAKQRDKKDRVFSDIVELLDNSPYFSSSCYVIL